MISNKAAFSLGKVVYWYFTQIYAWREFFREAPTHNDVAIRFAKHELKSGDIRIEITIQPRPGKIDLFQSMDTITSDEVEGYIAAVQQFLVDNHHGGIPFIEVELAKDEWR